MKLIPNSFEVDMRLPQAAGLKAASDEEIVSLQNHGVHQLVSITSLSYGQEAVATKCA